VSPGGRVPVIDGRTHRKRSPKNRLAASARPAFSSSQPARAGRGEGRPARCDYAAGLSEALRGILNSDFGSRKHGGTGERAPTVWSALSRTDACKALLGHPFILRSLRTLKGRNFIPTWDGTVVKVEGAGVAIPWHRDLSSRPRTRGAAASTSISIPDRRRAPSDAGLTSHLEML